MKSKNNFKEGLLLMAVAMNVVAAQAATEPKGKEANETKKVENVNDSTVTEANSKEVKHRNVMLGAGDSTTPRNLNIGLPFSGDILINENGVPVVYTFWTQIPTTAWRYDASLGRMGVMSFAEGALTFGKVGYVVNSYDREPGRKAKTFINVRTSTEGNFQYDANVTAPLGKGWGFSLSANETYNRGSIRNYHFSAYSDRMQMFKAGIYKKFKNGKVSLLYKYANDKVTQGAYSPWVYRGDGKVDAYEGFEAGHDSYILTSGRFPYVDFWTGQTRFAKLGEDSVSGNISNAIYFNGEYKFKNKMRLTFDAMYMHSKASFTIQYPISLSLYDKAPFPLYNEGSNVPYEGPVQMISSQYYPMVNINQFLAKTELTKRYGNHNLRLGMTFMNYRAPELMHSGVYFQTATKDPQLLAMNPADASMGYYQAYTAAGNGSYKVTRYTRTALYMSDDFRLTRWLSGGVGARIESENDKEKHYPYDNTTYNVKKADFLTHNFNGWNYVLTGNLLAQATKNFGFVAEATYNKYMKNYWDYDKKDEFGSPLEGARQDQANAHYESVLNLGAGIYWNIGQYLQLVSKITTISKNDIVGSDNAYNGNQQRTIYPIIYDIKTLGWTTDLVSSIGNFNMHFLFTLQNPEYKNYNYQAYGNNYSYSDKVIPELSKVLIEIDPSYYLFNRDVRVWVSARYFGKQYGNKPNTISYNGWWETFGGIDYHMNRYLDLKLQVNNILNQKGVSGSLVGGEQITDEQAMIGKGFVAGSIRPRCVELTASLKF